MGFCALLWGTILIALIEVGKPSLCGQYCFLAGVLGCMNGEGCYQQPVFIYSCFLTGFYVTSCLDFPTLRDSP